MGAEPTRCCRPIVFASGPTSLILPHSRSAGTEGVMTWHSNVPDLWVRQPPPRQRRPLALSISVERLLVLLLLLATELTPTFHGLHRQTPKEALVFLLTHGAPHVARSCHVPPRAATGRLA